MKRTSSASRRPLERGQFSWVTLVLVVGLAAAVYLGAVWAPFYILHYEVKQTTRDYMNRAVKNRDDAGLVGQLSSRLAALDTTEEIGDDGRKSKVPTVQVAPEDITWERDTSSQPPMLHVAFEYVRMVRYPWLERVDEHRLTVELDLDLTVPNWGK